MIYLYLFILYHIHIHIYIYKRYILYNIIHINIYVYVFFVSRLYELYYLSMNPASKLRWTFAPAWRGGISASTRTTRVWTGQPSSTMSTSSTRVVTLWVWCTRQPGRPCSRLGKTSSLPRTLDPWSICFAWAMVVVVVDMNLRCLLIHRSLLQQWPDKDCE